MSEPRSHLTTVLAAIGVALAMLLIIGGNALNKAAVEKNREIGRQNNTYLRVMTCIASVSPTERSPAYVTHCYNQAEHQTGVKITRYGDGE